MAILHQNHLMCKHIFFYYFALGSILKSLSSVLFRFENGVFMLKSTVLNNFHSKSSKSNVLNSFDHQRQRCSDKRQGRHTFSYLTRTHKLFLTVNQFKVDHLQNTFFD